MINIVSISFDKKTKIIMVISVIIAICLIIYNLFNIVIKEKMKDYIEEIDLNKVLKFESNYIIEVYSNKNSNIYNVYEETDFEEEKEKIDIENGIKILKEREKVNISINNSLENSFTYNTIALQENINFISLGDILNLYKNIVDEKIEGKIERINKDNNITIKCILKENAVNCIYIEIVDKQLESISIYSEENVIKYYIKIEKFEVKKVF